MTAVSNVGCMVLEMLAAGGNRWYLELLDVIGVPRYLGYMTPIVAPEPSIEQVAGAIHSIGGRIGTHIIMRALLWDWRCDHGAKASMIMTWNLMVVPTVEPPRLRPG
jgi:hypothetical protein